MYRRRVRADRVLNVGCERATARAAVDYTWHNIVHLFPIDYNGTRTVIISDQI